MGLFNSSDNANLKTESEEKTSQGSQSTAERQVKELLGKEFGVVKNGLNPDEVAAFLEAVAGSSEAGLKRLEHFISVERLSDQIMEAMKDESRRTAGNIKERVRQEAEAEKAQIIEEARRTAADVIDQATRIAEEIIDQTKKSCLASTARTTAILLEATSRTGEVGQLAFAEFNKVVDTTVVAMRQDIQKVVDRLYGELNSELARFPNKLSTSSVRSVDTSSPAREQETVPAEGHIPELARAEGSERTRDSALGSQPADAEIEDRKEPVSAKAGSVAPKDSVSELYSGEVILIIPLEFGQSWLQQLMNRLHDLSGLRTLVVGGTDAGRTSINLWLDEPIALTSILHEMPNVERVVDEQQAEQSPGYSAWMSGNRWLQKPRRPTLRVICANPPSTPPSSPKS